MVRQLFIRQRAFASSNDGFSIKDRSGKDNYFVKGDFQHQIFSVSIYDRMKNPIVSIDRNTSVEHPAFEVKLDDAVAFNVEKRMTPMGFEYAVDGSDVEIYDNWWSMNFDIMKGYRKVGKVRKRWAFSGESYELTIFEREYEEALIGLLTTFEYIKQLEDIEVPVAGSSYKDAVNK